MLQVSLVSKLPALVCIFTVMILKSSAYIFRLVNAGCVSQLGSTINSRCLATMSELLNKVPDVDIDDSGKFKYVLLNIHDKTNDAFKPVVRGYKRAEWHANIYDETTEQLKQYPDLEVEPLGGGRILRDPENKTIKVYGYSQGYGKADHQVSVDLLKKKYTDYNITWSDEGY